MFVIIILELSNKTSLCTFMFIIIRCQYCSSHLTCMHQLSSTCFEGDSPSCDSDSLSFISALCGLIWLTLWLTLPSSKFARIFSSNSACFISLILSWSCWAACLRWLSSASRTRASSSISFSSSCSASASVWNSCGSALTTSCRNSWIY